jgi:hypothetical protein
MPLSPASRHTQIYVITKNLTQQTCWTSRLPVSIINTVMQLSIDRIYRRKTVDSRLTAGEKLLLQPSHTQIMSGFTIALSSCEQSSYARNLYGVIPIRHDVLMGSTHEHMVLYTHWPDPCSCMLMRPTHEHSLDGPGPAC